MRFLISKTDIFEVSEDAYDDVHDTLIKYVIGISMFNTNTILYLSDIKGTIKFFCSAGTLKMNKKQKTKKKNFKKNLLLPSFTINFISSWKPEKLFSIVDIEHISVKEFANGNLEITHPTYILLEQDDGSYLKWKVFHLAPE